MSRGVAVSVWFLIGTAGAAAEPSAERGREYLLGHNYNPPLFGRAAHIGDRHIDGVRIGGNAPFYAAKSAAITEPDFPQFLAAGVGVQRIDDP